MKVLYLKVCRDYLLKVKLTLICEKSSMLAFDVDFFRLKKDPEGLSALLNSLKKCVFVFIGWIIGFLTLNVKNDKFCLFSIKRP